MDQRSSLPWILAALASPALGQSLVENINTDPNLSVLDSNAFGFEEVAGTHFFSADTPSSGRELWTTDGTPAGTQQFTDLYAGDGWGDPRYLTELPNGDILFAGRSAATGWELWKTDGTSAGVELVVDLWPGPEDSGVSYMTYHNGEAYFFAQAPGISRSLWKSDGTAAGTVLVSQLEVGGTPIFTNGTENLVSTPSGLLFTTAGGGFSTYVWRLWRTDGTPGGTEVLHTEMPGSSYTPGGFTEWQGQVYFYANDDLLGEELWVSDGTEAGTFLLADIQPGEGDSRPRALTPYNGELYFTAFEVSTGEEIWKTDGTTAGTVRVTDMIPGNPIFDGSAINYLTVINGTLVFAGKKPATGVELYGLGPGVSQPFLVADFNPGPESSSPWGMAGLGNEIYCRATRTDVGAELFATDGTPAGTRLVADITPGVENTWLHSLYALGGQLLFTADEPVYGEELWVTDGTFAGTQLLKDIAQPDLDQSSYPSGIVNLGDRALFRANQGATGQEIWTTDGTPGGTQVLLDINPGSQGSVSGNLFRVGDRAYFTAFENSTGGELWSTDGTPGGTQLVADIWPGSIGSGPWWFVEYEGDIYFRADDGVHGDELWKSDGTAAGTQLVIDLNPTSNSVPEYGVVHDGWLYFTAYSSFPSRELWRTDGTAANTQLVFDPGSTASVPLQFNGAVSFGPHLYFVANDGVTGAELWRTDGTPAGTQLFADLNPVGSSNPWSLTVVQDRLGFLADDGTSGRQLWVTDGVGVERLTEVDTGFGGTGIDYGLMTNGELFLARYNGPGGNQQLLRSDGTQAGTTTYAVIDPTGQYGPWTLTSTYRAQGDDVIFGGNDGAFGSELWATDGTALGTRRLTDVHPAGGDSNPSAVARLGDQLLFSANDGLVGTELWTMPFALLDDWVAETYGVGCPGSSGIAPSIGSTGSATSGDLFTLRLEDAAPLAPSFLYFSLGFAKSQVGGCSVYLDNPALLLGTSTDANGELGLPLVVPSDPFFVGLSLWFQFTVADPGGALSGSASLSDALEVILGG